VSKVLCQAKNCKNKATKVIDIGMVLCNKHFEESGQLINEMTAFIKENGFDNGQK